jgi:hypothetical protein
MVGVKSPLDTVVSFPVEERTLLQTISLILIEVENRSGTHILVGMMRGHVMANNLSVEAERITARDAMLVALNASDARNLEMGLPLLQMSWAMLFQADEQDYYLNLHATHAQPASDILLGKGD